mmetsp:Transcript_15238/g.38245  ORF Transcript_15238/g.38245 Transcript_15238/m.38245 type:complete len:221 (-) Transcript_15238:184-846(-)
MLPLAKSSSVKLKQRSCTLGLGGPLAAASSSSPMSRTRLTSAGTATGLSLAPGHSAASASATSPTWRWPAAERNASVTSLMRITNAGSSRAAAAGPFRPIWIDLTSGILRVSASLPCALGSICLSGSHWTITLPSPLAAIAESLCASLAFLSISKKRSLSRSRASTRDWFLSLSTVHPQRYAIHTALGLIHVMRESDHAPARCGARKEFAATAASAIAGL